jgi:hypothetical protein
MGVMTVVTGWLNSGKDRGSNTVVVYVSPKKKAHAIVWQPWQTSAPHHVTACTQVIPNGHVEDGNEESPFHPALKP